MSTLTTNYNLIKPDYADSADIADINGNMDVIDLQMKANADAIVPKQNSTDNTLTTTDKTIVGAINEVNAKKLMAYSIMLDTTLSSTETTYNTYSSRKFSDYTLIIFRFGASSADIRRTVVMPTSLWNSGKTINESILHGSTATSAASYNVTPIIVKYNSDTSIKANVGGAGSINHLEIVGIKFE